MSATLALTPRSVGKPLETGSDAFGFMRDSSGLEPDFEALQTRLASDGYLYLKTFLDPAAVLNVRSGLILRMNAAGLILAGTNPDDARAVPGTSTTFMAELANENPDLQALIYSQRVLGFFQGLLGSEVRHYDYTWFRPVGPGKGTAPHCDLVYMGRGTRRVFTLWVPYGHVPVELGGLLVLEGSHLQQDRLRAYLERDVDVYCENRDGAEKAKVADNLLWNGWLASNPKTLRQSLGGRWLTAEFSPGDAVIFGMTLVHGSLDNQTDRIRLSSDSRYQPASEAVDGRWIGSHPSGHSRAGKRGRIC